MRLADLAILNASPVSPALRYTDVFIPVTIPLASRNGLPVAVSYLPVMEVIIEFDKSGHWPDNLYAIQKIKLAFFEWLAVSSMAAVKGLYAAVVLRDQGQRSDIQDEAALDIVTPEGWGFRARIWHDREATLLDGVIHDQAHVPKALRRNRTGEEARERESAILAREVYTRRFVHAPRHHRAIAALAQRFTAFAGTVRLAKRWFAAHWLLGGHVSEEAVELLVGNVTTVAGRSSKPVAGAAPVVVATTDGHGAYRITLDDEVSVDPVADAPADVRMLAEALLRLVYGRLDPAHTPEGVEDPNGRLDDLRKAFPGF